MDGNLFKQQQQPPPPPPPSFDALSSSPNRLMKSSKVPPKKRPKMEGCDSADDVHVQSDTEVVVPAVPPKKCAVTVQTEPTFDPTVVSVPAMKDDVDNKTIVDTQVLHKELMDVRGALDQERRLRLLLEEQLHSLELSRLQALRQMSTVAMMDYQQQQQHHNNVQAPVLPVASNYDTLPLLSLSFSPAIPSPRSTPICPSESAGVNNGSSPPPPPPAPHSVSASPGVVDPVVSANYNNSRCVSSCVYPVSSKQSLEAIVEAIRHLEGDQMFVDSGDYASDSAAERRRSLMCSGALTEVADNCVSQSRPAIIISPLL
ncbi:unnamed protein product [Soboliphyme baturini]|uniref:P66_CC domain-containing protein n=1 Tax=Soboliphyme baturini TaxID=241478 RepID=A0A183IL90_9BILA|nr:unnamed protein product [Soboliphyme baturini]